MKEIHTPKIGKQYWVAIFLASIFGTNLGDFYAHDINVGIGGGLLLLALFFGMASLAERIDRTAHYYYYWLAIIIIRTAATNLADFLAGRHGMNLDRASLSAALALLLTWIVWAGFPAPGVELKEDSGPVEELELPIANGRFWSAMLVAGTFGTVLGDLCSHVLGGGRASLILTAILVLVLNLRGWHTFLAPGYYYWFVIAIVRSAGTVVGDWIAENQQLHIGLPASTLYTGGGFVVTLVLWHFLTETEGRVKASSMAGTCGNRTTGVAVENGGPRYCQEVLSEHDAD